MIKRKVGADLGGDNIIKLIIKLAVPAMLAQFVNVGYGIVDRIFIGNIAGIGDMALAGVGVCAPILTFITSFSFLVGLGGSPLAAIKLGEKDTAGAQKIMANCTFMLLIISALLTVIFSVLAQPMLMLFGASENTIEYAQQYLSIYALGSIFAIVSMGLNSFIICQGYSKISMMTVLIGAVVNTVLDPIFIFVFGMGVQGAAIATVIAQFVSCLWVVLFLLGKNTTLRISFKNLSIKVMLKVLKLGVSPFLIIAGDSIVLILFNGILQSYGGSMGDTYVLVATIVLSFMQIITLPLGGITMGCQPILSYNYGAMNGDRVKKAFFGIIIACLIFTCTMFVFAMTLPEMFANIFTRDSEIIALCGWGIRIFSIGVIVLAIQYAVVDSLTAMGQAGLAITLSLTRKLIILIPLMFMLPMFFGVQGVFFAEPIADVAASIISGTVGAIVINKIIRKRMNYSVPTLNVEPPKSSE